MRSLEGEETGHAGARQLAGSVDGTIRAGVELDVEQHQMLRGSRDTAGQSDMSTAFTYHG